MLDPDRPLVVVDVQPQYASHICFLPSLAQAIAAHRAPVLWFWNGDGLTRDDEASLRGWLREAGFARKSLSKIRFQEKSYGWLRGWMDNGIDEDVIVRVQARMLAEGLSCSDDLDTETLAALAEGEELSCDTIHRPPFERCDVAGFKGGWLVGGGADECLREVRLTLEAMKIPTETHWPLVY